MTRYIGPDDYGNAAYETVCGFAVQASAHRARIIIAIRLCAVSEIAHAAALFAALIQNATYSGSTLLGVVVSVALAIIIEKE